MNFCHSHKTITVTLKLSLMPFIRRNSVTNDALTLSVHCHSIFLPFNVFGRVHSRSSKIIVCYRVLTCDSGSESAKFYRLHLDFDSSRNDRIPPTSTPVSTPTPQPCSWLLDATWTLDTLLATRLHTSLA